MKRITILLPDGLADAVEHEARRRCSSVSAVIGDALSDRLQAPRTPPFAAVGRSGMRHTARDMERLMPQTWQLPE